MKNYSFNIERRIIENKFKKLKENKADPNDIVLNAAAIQDQMLIDMGMKKKKFTRKSLKPMKKEDETVLPQMLKKIVKKELDKEKDSKVLNRQKAFIKSLTFAQKIGWKEIPKMPLSLNEWKKLENQSINRQDHLSNCPICLDSFSKRESLILSCSHVFHKYCIQNFEKFTNTKKCPVCRTSNYEAKDYYKDKEFYISKSIILIQANYRGYIVRIVLYRNIFKFNMPKNKHLRSIYSYWKIKELTSNMCSIIDKKSEETKLIINKLEKEVEDIKRKSTNNNIQHNKNKVELNSDFDDWDKILQNMKQRKNDVCAICFTNLNVKKVYLLNCTHCFHKNCLDSFEKFDVCYEKRCPICRRNYEKKEYNMV